MNTSNWAYIANHFIILDEEIYNLFINKNRHISKESFIYFYRNNKIFVLSDKFQFRNSTLSMYMMNKKNEIELEMLLNFFDKNSRDECIKLIKEIGYDKYQGYLLFYENDLASPIFDINQKQIGNAYKYNESITDYTKYNISFEIRKIFLLYMNYKNLMKNPVANDNKFKGYYIVSKKWIQEYKKYYNYDALNFAIEQNAFIQNVFKNNYFNFNDKLLTLMIKQLPKNLLEDFNIRDKNIKFNNKERKGPEMGTIIYGSDKNLFYYYDFELICSEIYDYLFKSNLQNLYYPNFNKGNNQNIVGDKEENVGCIIDQNYLLIEFPTPTADNKYMLEIGKLNSEKVFEPEFFLLYDKYNYLCQHVNNVLSSAGFTTYCQYFNSLPVNTLDIIGNNNIIYGLAIKKNINPDYNNNIFQRQNLGNNKLYDQIQNMNTIIINKEKDGDEINNFIKLKDLFKWPPRVGLNNIGATCYMNATLQCFCQIEDFVIFFKSDNHVNEIQDDFNTQTKYLTPSFKKLIEEIWPKEAQNRYSKERHYSPEEFRKKIADMNPLFVNNQANDAKDLVNFIIMTLHEELNQSIPVNNINAMTTSLNNNNQQELVFKIFYEEYQRTFRSKISDLFYAISQTTTKCLNCENCQYNFQAYFFLVFPLEEVKKYKINQLNNNMNIINNNMNNNQLALVNNMNLMNNNMMNNNMNMMNNNLMMNNNMNDE